MFAEPFEGKDGYRIWLDLKETDQLLAAADSREERIAFALGVRSGLRVQEIVDVEAKDVVSTSAGPRVRVWHSKGKAYRETPTTKDILAMAETVADLQGPETPLVDHSTRWVQRHLDGVTGELAEDDEMWAHVTPHDLHRTWATLLSADINDPLLIMDFGGWEDIETFLEHYRGSYSPAVQRRELSKVDWLDVGERGVDEREPELSILEQRVDG
jgi:integrase